MPHDPRAIANEFLKLEKGPVNQMWLQKLVYMAHGWNLAINNTPLVNGRIEAWDGGPVMRKIWDQMRDLGRNAGGLFGFNADEPYTADLSEAEKAVIERVWDRYGGYTGRQLSDMTHQEGTPWSNAYFGRGRNAKLLDDDIKQHFTGLAIAGRG